MTILGSEVSIFKLLIVTHSNKRILSGNCYSTIQTIWKLNKSNRIKLNKNWINRVSLSRCPLSFCQLTIGIGVYHDVFDLWTRLFRNRQNKKRCMDVFATPFSLTLAYNSLIRNLQLLLPNTFNWSLYAHCRSAWLCLHTCSILSSLCIRNNYFNYVSAPTHGDFTCLKTTPFNIQVEAIL